MFERCQGDAGAGGVDEGPPTWPTNYADGRGGIMFLFAVPVAVREGVCGGGHERRRGRERDLCVCV